MYFHARNQRPLIYLPLKCEFRVLWCQNRAFIHPGSSSSSSPSCFLSWSGLAAAHVMWPRRLTQPGSQSAATRRQKGKAQTLPELIRTFTKEWQNRQTGMINAVFRLYLILTTGIERTARQSRSAIVRFWWRTIMEALWQRWNKVWEKLADNERIVLQGCVPDIVNGRFPPFFLLLLLFCWEVIRQAGSWT